MQSAHAHQEYVIVQINEEFTRRARKAGLDDQHQLVERHIAAGGEPLRDVMRRASRMSSGRSAHASASARGVRLSRCVGMGASS